MLEQWDREPHVISAVTDDPHVDKAYADMDWPAEIAAASAASHYLIAETDGRPVGILQIMDPHLEPSHYWGEIEPDLRALDIWIGPPDALGKGYGRQMMHLALERCFSDPAVTAVVIDPLASNTDAHRFYRRLGFVAEGHRMFGEDDCLVHRLTRDIFGVASRPRGASGAPARRDGIRSATRRLSRAALRRFRRHRRLPSTGPLDATTATRAMYAALPPLS